MLWFLGLGDAVPDPGDITQLLVAYRNGDRGALDRLVPIVYADLRRIARAHSRRPPDARASDTTSLVHEVYLRLVDQSRANWEDRAHFYSVCARAMRQIVISRARRRLAAKRGGGTPDIPWADDLPVGTSRAAWLLDLEQALNRLAEHDERLVRVVECRFFAGFTEQETADAVGTSLRTVQREWKRARAWLREDLGPDATP